MQLTSFTCEFIEFKKSVAVVKHRRSIASPSGADHGSSSRASWRSSGHTGSPRGRCSRLHPRVHGQQFAERPSAATAPCGEIPSHAQVRALPQSRRCVGAKRTQTLLPLERLHVRKVHPHRREAASDGRASGAPQTAGAGRKRSAGASTSLRHSRGARAGRSQRHHPAPAELRSVWPS